MPSSCLPASTGFGQRQTQEIKRRTRGFQTCCLQREKPLLRRQTNCPESSEISELRIIEEKFEGDNATANCSSLHNFPLLSCAS
jgi:hypothetical protein